MIVLEGKNNEKFVAIAVEGDQGGVYASNDAGASWKKLTEGRMRSVDRSADGRVWVAAGQGLTRSVDGGATWTKLSEFPFAAINDVTLNPRNPGEIWVGTAGCGIYKGF
jgi:photosystem II stability/assembly factor-like uncharacterized protein